MVVTDGSAALQRLCLQVCDETEADELISAADGAPPEAVLACWPAVATSLAPSLSARWLQLLLSALPSRLLTADETEGLWRPLCGVAGLRSGQAECRAKAAQAAALLRPASPHSHAAVMLSIALEDTHQEPRRASLAAALALLGTAQPALSEEALLSLSLPLLAAVGKVAEEELRRSSHALLARLPSSLLAAHLMESLGRGADADDEQAPVPLALRAAAEGLRSGLVQPGSGIQDALAAAATRCVLDRESGAHAAADALAGADGGFQFALSWLAAQEATDGASVQALTFGLMMLGQHPRHDSHPSPAIPLARLLLERLRPPPALCDSFAELPGDGAAFAAAAALRLQLLARALLPLLARGELWQPAARRCPADGEAWPHGGEGVEDGGARLGPACALVAASFACGGVLHELAAPGEGHPHWGSPEAAAAAEELLDGLRAAWLAAKLGGPPGEAAGAMLSCSLAARGPTLRAALLPASAAADGLLGEGAKRSAALLAAQMLRAALSRLGHPWASAALPAVLPPLLLALEALPAACRAHAQLATLHLAGVATTTALRLRGAALLQPLIAQGLSFHREPAAGWSLAVRSASALASALGEEARAQLLQLLVDALTSQPDNAHCARPVLRALPPLCRAEGLRLLLYTRCLLPALLEWVEQTGNAELRADAAEALTACMEVVWPRAEFHAPRIWPVLLAAHAACCDPSAAAEREAGRQRDRCAAALARLARQLHYAGGAAFRDAWRQDEARHGGEPAMQPMFSLLRSLGGASEVVVAEPAVAAQPAVTALPADGAQHALASVELEESDEPSVLPLLLGARPGEPEEPWGGALADLCHEADDDERALDRDADLDDWMRRQEEMALLLTQMEIGKIEE